jgi:hypothetical protein
MDISGTSVPEERIAALEKKVRDMDALVKGLLEELLDFRAVAMAMTRQSEERDRLELKQGPVVLGTISPSGADTPEGVTVIRPREAHQPAAPAEPTMVRIMQTDGTMKMEARYGETGMISSTGGYGRNKKGASAKTPQAPLIYAADEEKSGSSKK